MSYIYIIVQSDSSWLTIEHWMFKEILYAQINITNTIWIQYGIIVFICCFLNKDILIKYYKNRELLFNSPSRSWLHCIMLVYWLETKTVLITFYIHVPLISCLLVPHMYNNAPTIWVDHCNIGYLCACQDYSNLISQFGLLSQLCAPFYLSRAKLCMTHSVQVAVVWRILYWHTYRLLKCGRTQLL